MGTRLGCAVLAMAFAGAVLGQVPAGTRSVDDHSREDAKSQQLRDAESALEKQDYKGAETQLKALASANPKDGRVLYDLGFAEERNDEEADAAKAYAASAVAVPGFAEPRIALGLLDARAGRSEAARRELLEAASIANAAPELRARAYRALAHLDETSDPNAAREELLAALKLSAETPDDVLMGAELAERAGDPIDADVAYRRALKLLPDDVDAIAGLVHVLQQQGKLADADVLLGEALKAHPNDPRLVAQAATLYAAENKPEQAISMLQQLRAADPKAATDPNTTLLLARLEYLKGDNATAEQLYQGLLKSTPNDPVLLDALGSAQVKQGKDAEAEVTLRKAVGLRAAFHDDQAWGEAAAHLAFAASKNHDPKVCLEALTARATVLPNSPTSLFLQATSLDTLHQYKEAAKAYKSFLALSAGKFPDQEFEAQHRLVALDHMH